MGCLDFLCFCFLILERSFGFLCGKEMLELKSGNSETKLLPTVLRHDGYLNKDMAEEK